MSDTAIDYAEVMRRIPHRYPFLLVDKAEDFVSGQSIVKGLRLLASGPTKYTTLGPNLLPAFQKLSTGAGITAVGSFGVLDWDADGAVKGGTLEMWCIGGTSAKPVYQSSGLLFDIMTQKESGTYKQCGQ